MCGIVYVKRNDGKGAAKGVLKRYEKQKDRGQSGFGYLAINGKIEAIRRTDEKDIMAELAKEKADEILFHHRTPTSIPNIVEGAHPLEVENKLLEHKYYVVHNGVMLNDSELKAKHEKMGFVYQTEIEQQIITRQRSYSYGKKWNDSEAFAIELALAIEGKQKKVEAKGASAFVALQADKTGKQKKLFFGRNKSNPLKSYRQKELWTITSEGAGEEVKPHILYWFDYETGKLGECPLEIGDKSEMSFWERYGIGSKKGKQNEYHSVVCPCDICEEGRQWDEEEDFLIEREDEGNYELLKAEREHILAELKKAQGQDNYDTELELEQELEFINAELESYGKRKPRVIY